MRDPFNGLGEERNKLKGTAQPTWIPPMLATLCHTPFSDGDPTGAAKSWGALLIGYYDDGKLRYAGKVGTGFDQHTLESLYGRLSPRKKKRSPFADMEISGGGKVHWVSPELIAEIAFTEWTQDNRLRQARYLGLREDKTPKEGVKEE